MTFLEHLDELRTTVLRSLGAFLVAFLLVAVFLRDAAEIGRWPLAQGLGPDAAAITLATITPMAVFTVILQVCFVGALGLSLPFILLFIGQFVAPALVARERRILIPFCFAALLLFLAGAAFSFFLLTPAAIRVAKELNDTLGFQTNWTPDSYYGLVLWLILTLGLSFQFPLVLLVLIHLQVVSIESLRSARRYAYTGMFVFSCVVTPTGDPLTAALVTLPLLVLYEAALLVGAMLLARRARAEAEAEAEAEAR